MADQKMNPPPARYDTSRIIHFFPGAGWRTQRSFERLEARFRRHFRHPVARLTPLPCIAIVRRPDAKAVLMHDCAAQEIDWSAAVLRPGFLQYDWLPAASRKGWMESSQATAFPVFLLDP